MNPFTQFLRFMAYATWVAVLVMLCMNAARPDQPAPQRYELRVFNDGEVLVFDTGTGEMKKVREGDGPQVLPSKPDPSPESKQF